MACTPHQFLKGTARTIVAHRLAIAIGTAVVLGVFVNPALVCAAMFLGLASLFYQHEPGAIAASPELRCVTCLETRQKAVFAVAIIAGAACTAGLLMGGAHIPPGLQDELLSVHFPVGTSNMFGSLATMAITMLVFIGAFFLDQIGIGLRPLCDQGARSA